MRIPIGITVSFPTGIPIAIPISNSHCNVRRIAMGTLCAKLAPHLTLGVVGSALEKLTKGR